jgi:hypothetical protein
VSTIEELLGRKKSSFSGLEKQDYGRRDPLCGPRNTLSAKVGTNFADKWQSLGIVYSRSKAMEFVSLKQGT